MFDVFTICKLGNVCVFPLCKISDRRLHEKDCLGRNTVNIYLDKPEIVLGFYTLEVTSIVCGILVDRGTANGVRLSI